MKSTARTRSGRSIASPKRTSSAIGTRIICFHVFHSDRGHARGPTTDAARVSRAFFIRLPSIAVSMQCFPSGLGAMCSESAAFCIEERR